MAQHEVMRSPGGGRPREPKKDNTYNKSEKEKEKQNDSLAWSYSTCSTRNLAQEQRIQRTIKGKRTQK